MSLLPPKFPLSLTTRRGALGLAGAAAIGLPLGSAPAQGSGLTPDTSDDQSGLLRDLLAEAAGRGRPLVLPPGRYRVSGIDLPDGAVLGGVPGHTVLASADDGPILACEGAGRITLGGLVVDGGGIGGAEAGLIDIRDCARLTIEACEVRGGAGDGVRLARTGGRVSGCLLEDHARAALFSTDAADLEIVHNTVRRCSDNGVLVWTGAPGPDGTRVAHNTISAIAARSGGTGENGNGVNIYRAGEVSVTHNTITDCAFSAVRNNGGANARISSNTCRGLAEVAIYAEFAFDGAIVTDNVVDDAAVGISITNMREGGRLAVCANNIVRRVRNVSPTVNVGTGIAVEADASVTGNVVEGAPGTGLALGWGPYLRDVTASGNTVRRCGLGIGISVAGGAGGALVTGNTIAECARAIAGTLWERIAEGDVNDAPGVTLGTNRVR